MGRARSWWHFPLLCLGPIWYSIQIRFFIRNFICFTNRVTLLYPSCMFIAVLPWANRSVGVGYSLKLKSTLGSRQTCTLWLGTFGCPGGMHWNLFITAQLTMRQHWRGNNGCPKPVQLRINFHRSKAQTGIRYYPTLHDFLKVFIHSNYKWLNLHILHPGICFN